MALSLLLFSHITGALLLGYFIVSALVQIYTNKENTFKKSAITIGLAAGYQLITGSLLALDIQTKSGLFGFCSKIGLYLAIVISVEYLLFYRMQKNTAVIMPARLVLSSLIIGIVFTGATILHISGNI
jgi:hypothetical protein